MQSVCIGVHVHAEPERLQATLHSLQAHTRQVFDLLLLPDGPDIATATALSRLRHLPQLGTVEPLGPPACFNRLVTSSSADILILLESGALVGPDWLDYLLAALTADPLNGLAGPSTNRSWNEQGVFPRAGATLAEVARTAWQAAQRFGTIVRTLESLYSLGDFCYAVRREVVAAIGMADEQYGLGPCWEMDYNIRAARAGFRGVWACGAYVYRAPFTARRRLEESLRFETSKHLYQDKFCGLRLRGEKAGYEVHCRGEACEHFAPPDLIQITLHREVNTQASEKPLDLGGARSNEPGTPSLQSSSADGRSNTPLKTAEEIDLSTARTPATTTSINDPPLVSCIMPTRNRRVFVQQAIRFFERQDYPNKELIIIDDGDDQVGDLVSDKPDVRYKAVANNTSIGAKRNLACQLARGDIIAHWDDDDWYAPHRLSHQVRPLLSGQADMTGLETSCFFDLNRWQAWTCTPELHRRLFVGDVHGGTLVYWRRIWEYEAHYPEVSLAEDARFLQLACRRGARLQKLPHAYSFVYLRHDGNAWRFPLGTYLQPTGWQRTEPGLFLPPGDLSFYKALSPAASSSASSKDDPLVSCIMPTYNRRAFVEQAIAYFLRQDYPNKELIIVDDGTDAIGDLVSADGRFRYMRLNAKTTVGAKRNLACEQARGPLIAHWDDDDWHAPHRLRYQLEPLLQEGTDLVGINTLLFYDPGSGHAWQYAYRGGGRVWLSGSSLCYKRNFWASNRFANINVGEDARFVWNGRPERIMTLPDATFHVSMIHPHNVSPKKTSGSYWRPYPVEEIKRLLGADWAFYQTGPTRFTGSVD